jgi:hypothetical protein
MIYILMATFCLLFWQTDSNAFATRFGLETAKVLDLTSFRKGFMKGITLDYVRQITIRRKRYI